MRLILARYRIPDHGWESQPMGGPARLAVLRNPETLLREFASRDITKYGCRDMPFYPMHRAEPGKRAGGSNPLRLLGPHGSLVCNPLSRPDT